MTGPPLASRADLGLKLSQILHGFAGHDDLLVGGEDYERSRYPLSQTALEQFALEIVALRRAKLAYANLAGLVTLRSTRPEHFAVMYNFKVKML